MAKWELFGARSCPFSQEMREWLEFRGFDFVEYDVESDPAAFERMKSISGGLLIPVLAEDGKASQIGWQGRGCLVGRAA